MPQIGPLSLNSLFLTLLGSSLGDESLGPYSQEPKKGIYKKTFTKKPPPRPPHLNPRPPPHLKRPLTPQILYVWVLFSLQNTARKRRNIKSFEGGGGRGCPKILYVAFLRVLVFAPDIQRRFTCFTSCDTHARTQSFRLVSRRCLISMDCRAYQQRCIPSSGVTWLRSPKT